MAEPFDLSVTDKLLSTTRAVRRRLDFGREVERQVLLDCIALAQQAPTASNTQLWRWLIVTDPEKRKAVGDIYRSGASAIANARSQTPEEDKQTQRVYDSAEWLLDHVEEAPAIVFPCLEGRLAQNAPLLMQASVFGSIFPAVWNFQLALRSRGLGSVLTTVHLLREKDLAELLGIPDDVMQVAMLPVAYTQGVDFKRANRPPPEDITHWNGWS
jgi:nitroreductase